MRAIWKGSITFGLVNVPVKLYSATEEHDLQLHQVHDADGHRGRVDRRARRRGHPAEGGEREAVHHITAPMCQGANSSAPNPSSSLTVLRPEATSTIVS